MPESRRRKKAPSAPRSENSSQRVGNPSWWVPVMLGLMILGLIWVVVTYIAQTAYPVPGIGSWNLAIGFGLILVGFGMTMRWQ